jgi:hypothetical protein
MLLDKLLFWKTTKAKGNDEYKNEPNAENENKIASFFPINGGNRSSSVSTTNSFGYGDKEREIYPEFSLEWIKVLRNYSVFDRNVSRAINNTVSLAQTNYEIELPDNLSKRDRKKVMETIRIFEKEAKLDSFIRNAIRTVTYAGGIAVDTILTGKPFINAVQSLAILDITSIRFNYNPITNEYIPKQINTGSVAEKILRKETFFYECVTNLEENPYPVPTLLAALDDIITQKDMLDNFKIIVKKLGMMGFLEVMVAAPEQNKGEDDTAFYARCSDYLNQQSKEIDKSLSTGYVMGFKDSSTFKMNATNVNFGGAEKAFEIINRLLNNGLQTDGVFMNQNNNTSETFARVLLQVLIGNIDSIQKTVASVLGSAMLLHLKLQGFKIDWLNVVFEKPLIGDELKDAQAEALKIANTIAKENAGYITSDMAAQELGYEQASGIKKEMPANTPNVEIAPDNNTNPTKDINVGLESESKKKVNFEESETDFKDEYLTKNADNYTKAIEKKYKSASKKLVDLVIDTIKGIENVSDTDLVTIFFLAFEQNWNILFTENIQTDIETYTQKVYNKYRKDKSIFPKEEEAKTDNSKAIKASFVSPPEVIIDALDTRLIQYLAELDSFYLGKFVLTGGSGTRFTQMILDFYVAIDGEIGNSDTLDDFADLLNEEMNLERYKIRRIIDTTMTNARNFANIKYINQAGIARFRRVEIGDRLTCAYCKAMDGDIYEIATEIRKAETFVSSNPDDIVDISPFATTFNLEKFIDMSAAERQAQGIGGQAAHPHCRGRIVADI